MINTTINATVSNIVSLGQLTSSQTIWVALGSLATTATVIVALFRDEIRALYSKPKLEFVKNIIDPQEVTAGQYWDAGDLCYIYQKWWQVVIVNKGRSAAKNVRLYFTGVDSDNIKDFNRFISIPMNTSWAHARAIADLPPQLNRSFDLGYISSTDSVWNFALNGGKTPKSLMGISGSATKLPLKFKVRLVICADNASTTQQDLELEVDPNDYATGVNIKFVN